MSKTGLHAGVRLSMMRGHQAISEEPRDILKTTRPGAQHPLDPSPKFEASESEDVIDPSTTPTFWMATISILDGSRWIGGICMQPLVSMLVDRGSGSHCAGP